MVRLSGKGGSMSTLRTLKDIEFEDCEITAQCMPCIIDGVDWDKVENKLRQEAIKWVKSIRTKPCGQAYSVEVWKTSRINWIKHFFNITDGDLK